jgi:hypothetical protein
VAAAATDGRTEISNGGLAANAGGCPFREAGLCRGHRRVQPRAGNWGGQTGAGIRAAGDDPILGESPAVTRD